MIISAIDQAEWHINMRVAPRKWTAEPWEYQFFPNPSYLNSLWLGIGWNIVLVPWRFLHEVIVPLLHLQLVQALILLILLPISVVRLAVSGLLGRCHAVRMPIEVAISSRTMTPGEADAALKAGASDLFVHRSKR